MGNRKKIRKVQHWPKSDTFLPKNIHVEPGMATSLPLDGFEALRLVDWEGLSQKQAAEMMGISGPTLSRILGRARRIVAGALTNALPICIKGGDYLVLNG